MIRSIDAYRYRLPLRSEVRLGPSLGAVRNGVCIRLSDGVFEGWGDAAPLPGFSRESIEDVLRAVDFLQAQPPMEPSRLLSMPMPPSLQFAVDTALHELAARQEGRPMLVDPAALIQTTLGVASLVDDAEDAAPVQPSKSAVVKLKVGGNWRNDLRRVETLRERRGSDVRIRLDANRRFSVADALDFLVGLAGLNVDFVEEPVAPGLALADRLDVPIAADETISELLTETVRDGQDLVRSVRERAPWASVLVLKPALLGTWKFTRSICDAARAAGLRCVLGGAYESGVGVRAGLALAAIDAGHEAVGFDSYNRIERDLLRPRLEIGETVDVQDACRLDRTVDLELLDAVPSHE
ncbi:MAG TPA: enolase C-terminal domain-like protein [Rhodothermales bacterium]